MIKPIAIYLPQFHPIPENDKAWGEGFTEWTNVRKAKPLFEGHYQPHVPHEDVGYYDLRDPEVMVRQAAMAKAYGIYGFAFYHYWFNGKQLLETPLDNMLKSGKPDFPFLYIWANEHWSRRWDGSEHEIIQEQHYSHEDDLNHIRFLCENVFSDKRYITIDEKPVFMVYRTELLPDIKETARIWREEARKFGFKDLYLVRVENFVAGINPLEIGFDAAMEFAPDSLSKDIEPYKESNQFGLYIQDYNSSIKNFDSKFKYNYKLFRGVYPGWDNTARKNNKATIFINNNQYSFKYYLNKAILYTKFKHEIESQFIFINAWNEWAEGCHIEPDIFNGYSYLESIKESIDNDFDSQIEVLYTELASEIERNYQDIEELYNFKNTHIRNINSRAYAIFSSAMSFYRLYKRFKDKLLR